MVVAGGSEVGWVVESWFGEVRVSCLRVCEVWLHQVHQVCIAVDVQVEVAIAVGAAVVGQLRRRKEQGHCVGEGSLGVKMAVVGIEAL